MARFPRCLQRTGKEAGNVREKRRRYRAAGSGVGRFGAVRFPALRARSGAAGMVFVACLSRCRFRPQGAFRAPVSAFWNRVCRGCPFNRFHCLAAFAVPEAFGIGPGRDFQGRARPVFPLFSGKSGCPNGLILLFVMFFCHCSRFGGKRRLSWDVRGRELSGAGFAKPGREAFCGKNDLDIKPSNAHCIV